MKKNFLSFSALLASSIFVTSLAQDNVAWFNAIRQGVPAPIEAMIADGADVNITFHGGIPILSVAALMGHEQVVKLLLKNGADVHAKDADDSTALIYAARNKKTDTVMVLLDAGAKVNEKNKKGRAALMEAVEINNFDIVKILLTAGADVNLRDFYGVPILNLAVKNCNEKTIKLLMDAGASANVKENFGFTALLISIQEGKTEIVKTLLAEGADVNENISVLALSRIDIVKRGFNDEIIKLLLAAGAGSNNDYGILIFEYALELGKVEILKLFFDKLKDDDITSYQFQNTLWNVANKRGNSTIAKLLLDVGVDIQIPENRPRHPQHSHIQQSLNEKIEIDEAWLVDHGLDPEKNWSDEYTPNGLTFGQLYLLGIEREKNKDDNE